MLDIQRNDFSKPLVLQIFRFQSQAECHAALQRTYQRIRNQVLSIPGEYICKEYSKYILSNVYFWL